MTRPLGAGVVSVVVFSGAVGVVSSIFIASVSRASCMDTLPSVGVVSSVVDTSSTASAGVSSRNTASKNAMRCANSTTSLRLAIFSLDDVSFFPFSTLFAIFSSIAARISAISAIAVSASPTSRTYCSAYILGSVIASKFTVPSSFLGTRSMPNTSFCASSTASVVVSVGVGVSIASVASTVSAGVASAT